MRTSAISTASFWNTPLTGAARMQTDLARATKEAVTGRYADVGLQLGARVGLSIGLRQQSAELAAIKEGNATTSLRLSTTQAALKQMQAGADANLATLTGLPVAQRAAIIKGMATGQLASLTATLNTTAGGQSVFGGTNTRQTPVAGYAGPPASAAKAAVDAAFLAAFGVTQDSAAAGRITGAQMTDFLKVGGALDTLFDSAAWKANWSSATDATLDSRISLTDTVTTSASANAPAIRKLAMAYVIGADLGVSSLSAEAQAAATDKVMSLLSQASGGLVATQADLGRSQAAITGANTRIEAQTALLQTQGSDLESVDPAEAKTRIDNLKTQIQISYSLTTQLRQLSLVSYI